MRAVRGEGAGSIRILNLARPDGMIPHGSALTVLQNEEEAHSAMWVDECVPEADMVRIPRQRNI